jgi:two-component system, response regulator, stage 0 sporulation protein F
MRAAAAGPVRRRDYEDDYEDEMVDPATVTVADTSLLIGGRRVRIMLAEDDAEMRTLLVDSFARDGYEVIAAQNGLEMIEEIRMLLFRGDPLPVDLIVSDERMPGMPGLEFLSVLREAEWPTPFILITGFGDERIHERAMQMGASAVFDKPFDIDDLRRTVFAVLTDDRSARGTGRPTPPASAVPTDNPGRE